MKLIAEHAATVAKGLLGIAAPTGGFYVSIMPQIEAWLRVTSLVVGVAVGIATLISIIRKLK